MNIEDVDPTIQDLIKLSRYSLSANLKLACEDPITNAINLLVFFWNFAHVFAIDTCIIRHVT